MFKNLYSTIKTISLGLLCFAGNQVYSQTWEGVGTLDKISSGGSLFNQLVIAPFYDSGLQKGNVKKFDGTSWSDVGGASGVGAQYGNYSSLSGDALGNLYFTNKNSASLEVRKFDGSAWSQLPNAETTNMFAQSSAVSPTSNIPYVFSGASSGSVKKFDNGTWTNVGATGFAGSTNPSSPKIIINNGQIYVSHNGSGLKVHTISENASSTDAWTLVGGGNVGANFTESVKITSDMVIGPNSIPYVVYTSSTANGRKLNVKKFNGTQWEFVGAENFGLATYPLIDVSITVTPDDKIFVAAKRWNDNGSGDKNTVYHYNQSSGNWETLGGDYISDGMAENNVIKYDANTNSLILVYSQSGTRVRKFALPTTTTTCNNADPGNTPGDTSCVTFTYKGQPVTYTTVRGADGKIWLQQNLGSSQVATSQADADSYGDLFQWGRWDDGHQSRNSGISNVPTVNSPDGLNGVNSFIVGSTSTQRWWGTNALSDQWTAANAASVTSSNGADPCKAIGQGWKMPSQPEWGALVSAEAISNPAGAYGSHLKLPVAGNRSFLDGTSFSFAGERGYYWSSDTANSGGKYVYIGSMSVQPNSGAPRAQGSSVRCIKETSGLSTSDIKKVNVGVYPNPTNGILNIKVDSEIQHVNVTNIVGQRIDVQFKNNQVNMNGLPNGVYIVELALKNGQKIAKKVIKN